MKILIPIFLFAGMFILTTLLCKYAEWLYNTKFDGVPVTICAGIVGYVSAQVYVMSQSSKG